MQLLITVRCLCSSTVAVFILFILVQPCHSEGDATLSFCKNGKDGEWRNRLSKILIEVPVTVDDVYCRGIKSDQYGVSIARDFGRDVDIVTRSQLMTEEEYFNNIISKLTQDRVVSVSKPILSVLNQVYEAIVALVETDSQSHREFHRAALTSSLPSGIKVYQVSNQKFLPSHVRSQVTDESDLHVWVVTNGQWSRISLNTKQSGFDNQFHILMDVFDRLKIPLKLKYESPRSYDEYLRYGYHLFIVYHRADQLDHVHNTITDPLVNVFRPYFVFVTFNLDQYSPPDDVDTNGPFPLVVILKHGEKTGLQVNSNTITYSTETFKNIMEEMIGPAESDDQPPQGTVITMIDAQALKHISDSDADIPVVAALCEKGSIDCTLIEERMQRAVIALHKLSEEYELTLYLVKCDSVEDVGELVSVPQLPYLIVRDNDEWTIHSETLKVTTFITTIQKYGKSLNTTNLNNEENGESQSTEEYYDSFPALNEDDFVAQSFPEYFSIPNRLPSLTNQNYLSFIEENENCLIAFYIPYSFSCKPMVYHILNTTEQLTQGGLYPSVVNCADYPDVCESFGVVQFPMVKYRIGFNSEWITFTGILSNIELLKLLPSYEASSQEHYDTTDKIVELTPTLLLKLLKDGGKGDGLTTLLMIVSEEVTPHNQETLSIIKDHQVYWINSTRYHRLSEFLLGEKNSLEPPILVWADYVQHLLHRIHLKETVTKQEILSFMEGIHNGRPHDAVIEPSEWSPLSSPIKFPSEQFLYDKNYRNYEDRHYHDDESAPADTHRRPHDRDTMETGHKHVHNEL